VSPVVFDLLVECAEREKIPFSIQAAPHDTGTDADAIYNALRGIPNGTRERSTVHAQPERDGGAGGIWSARRGLLAAFAPGGSTRRSAHPHLTS